MIVISLSQLSGAVQKQSQKAVTAHFSIEQLLPFDFADQCDSLSLVAEVG